jgi:2-polyprenyl-6-methoxyphenol hydroxylase-like FAD-dependent oxidoreductase
MSNSQNTQSPERLNGHNGHGNGASGAPARRTDVAILGGGVAGSMAAAMLGRAGIDAVLIDIHKTFPRDFRCEKLDAGQLHLLDKTGLTDAVIRASTRTDKLWVVRAGRKLEKEHNGECYFFYDMLVNAVRGEIPQSVPFIDSKADGLTTGPDRQIITLANGETISARLVVLASGLNLGLGRSLGITREVLSTCHSLSIGFNLTPASGGRFRFPALTYFPESTADRIAYFALFPIGSVMRVNMFAYHGLNDPWPERLRAEPEKTLFESLPGLKRFTGEVEASERVTIRPIDLYVSKSFIQPGVVLIGDAYSTSCPAAGTGVTKALVDVERLCNVHIPQWLATDGMTAEKIAVFYDDPVKAENEAFCRKKAFRLRSITLQSGPYWRARSWARSLVHIGAVALQRA